MMGTEINRKRGEKNAGRMGRERGNACEHS